MDKIVSGSKGMPQGQHYAVLVFKSVRVNDGYGTDNDRSYTLEYTEYRSFEDETSLKEWVKYNESKAYGRESYVSIFARPVSVKITVDVEVKDG